MMLSPTPLHFLAHQLMDTYAFDVKGLSQRIHVPQAILESILDQGADNPRVFESLQSLASQLAEADGVCLSIRYLREAMGYSRPEFATLLNSHTVSLQKMERGDHLPSLTTLRALWAVFSAAFSRLKLEDFFAGNFDNVVSATTE
jgi:DNA-binding transcriptional regulator YiaG